VGAVFIGGLVAAAAPSAADVPGAPPDASAPQSETISDEPCWFSQPGGREVRCGVLTVPESRDGHNARMLRLRFVRFRAAAQTSLEPVVNISGGPGAPAGLDGAAIGRWSRWIERENWLRDRDFVLFDQRGVGQSEPNMSCPELEDAAAKVFAGPPSPDAADALWARSAAACAKRLAAEGVDLQAYNTAAIVADLGSLLDRLGEQSWILLAESYGTRVAMQVAIAEPARIHALILDSVDPPNVGEYVTAAPAAASAFTSIFQLCAAQMPCSEAFPELALSFDQLLRRATTKPVPVPISRADGAPFSAALDDGRLLEVLMQSFYEPQRLDELPAAIAAASSGRYDALAPLLQIVLHQYSSDGVSLGLHLSVECHDEFPFASREAVARASSHAPLFRRFALSILPLAACPAWPAGAAPSEERSPTRIAAPSLILSGTLDPVTPPLASAVREQWFQNSFAVTFPGAGHGVLGGDACASRIVEAFLADDQRAPNQDCVHTLATPKFKTSSVGGSIAK